MSTWWVTIDLVIRAMRALPRGGCLQHWAWPQGSRSLIGTNEKEVRIIFCYSWQLEVTLEA